MIVIHSDRTGFTNFDNVFTVSVAGRFIHARLCDGNKEILAVYQTEDRAEEVFSEMLGELFPPQEEIDKTFSDKVLPFIASSPDLYDDFDESVPVLSVLPQWYYMPEE